MWVYILGAFCLGLALLLVSPVVIGITYDETLKLWVRLWFVRFWVIPRPKKKKQSPSPKKPPKKQPAEKQPTPIKGLVQKYGMAGAIRLTVGALSAGGKSAYRLFKGAKIKGMELTLGITGDDAADAAITYGQVCSVLYPALGTLAQYAKPIDPKLNVYCDYLSKQPVIKGQAYIHIPVYHVVGTALYMCKELIIKVKGGFSK